MEGLSNIIVSIIIVAAGRKGYLESCLDSLKKQTFVNIEIIVIDNSVDLEKNLSYCEALNKGIDLCKGDFVLCLNDDVILEGNFIDEALRGFKIDQKIGMVSGKILRRDKTTIDSAGLSLSIFRSAREKGYGVRDKGQFEKEGYVFGVNGAVGFYRKSMLEQNKINREYFDVDFGFFYEDLDIAWRAHNFGWKAFYTPKAIAYHIRGGTARKHEGLNKRFVRRFLNDELHFDLVKNRYLAIIKNESISGLLLHLPFIIFYDIFVWGFIIFFRPQLIKKISLLLPLTGAAFKKRALLMRKKQLL